DASLSSANGSISARQTGDRLTARSRDASPRRHRRVKPADPDTAHGAGHATGLTAARHTASSRDGRIPPGCAPPPMDVRAEPPPGSIRRARPRGGEGYDIAATASNGRERIAPLLRRDSAAPRQITLDTVDGGISVDAADQRTW